MNMEQITAWIPGGGNSGQMIPRCCRLFELPSFIKEKNKRGEQYTVEEVFTNKQSYLSLVFLYTVWRTLNIYLYSLDGRICNFPFVIDFQCISVRRHCLFSSELQWYSRWEPKIWLLHITFCHKWSSKYKSVDLSIISVVQMLKMFGDLDFSMRKKKTQMLHSDIIVQYFIWPFQLFLD